MIVKKTIDRLTRRKFVTFDDTSLPRVLNTVDLTALGIGSTVGVGFYVLAGEVAKNTAGPAVTISFLIAAVASVFAGLCYAEFGARVPKAGSAYIYSYVCVGEFVAFVIGWNLILEYVIGTASVARGYSGYVDKLANNSMSEALGESMPISVSFLSEYPDFLAFGLSFILSVVLAVGVKESSMMNNIFTFINLVVIAYVIIAAGTQAEGKNWAIPAADVEATCKNPNSTCINVADDDDKDYGYGGFAPYGFKGIMQGAATCFFGFVGFDCIATTGEEAINPERSIPMSIGLSLLFVFIAYFGMSAVTTLALPYCWQDENAPLVQLFECLDMNTAKWIVSIGALFGFSASLFGAMFPLPRVIYAMADDGLLFRFLSKVNKKFKTPAIATVLSGLFAGIMAMIFNLDALVDMMSIGTLLAYSIVAVCVMLLRYAEDEDGDAQGLSEAGGRTKPGLSNSKYSASDYFQQLFNIKGLKEPTDLTASLASYATLVFCILSSVLGILLVVLQEAIAAGDVGAIVGISISSVLVIVNVVVIARQPESKKKLTFKVPLVPWIPALSAFINLYLMFNLSPATWIRFSVWMALGFLIYFLYGLWNSTEELKSKGKWKGVDNPGFVNDERNNSRLQVIPTIEIQPATPCSSEPNTPSTVHKTPRAKTPLPESPLVTAERQTTSAEVHRKETGSVSENEIKEVLASLDRIVSGSEKKRIDSETNASILEDDQELHSSSPKRLSNSDIQARELPPLPDTGAEEDGSSSENEEETVDKKAKKKPEPFELQTDPKEDSTDNESSLKVSASAPVLPLSSPPPVPPPFPQAGKGLSTSSVPSTPVIRKHPFKVLKRMSSFDDIPPSSPDSPLARHLNKFIIIPVHEPDSDSDASAQASPRESLQDPLMKELTARFKAKEGDNSPEIDKDDKKLFYVGSDDSLESAMAGTDSNSFVANLPSPTITAQTREFKRVLTKDSMLDGLDTIRERGESKIFASEEDKPKENISEKSQDLHSLPESQHESKKDTPKNDETDSPPDDLAKEESSNSLPVSGEEPVKPSFFVGQQEEEGISETERISDAQNEKQSAAEQVVSSSDSESEKQPEVETPVHETNPETESAPEPKRAVQRSQSKNEEFNRLKSMFDK
ncbi:Low affinity cationic amino acid transporter 2 [Penaeus vannamei]|uniref:Low affinity cationic amino acid transporter 2 n=1 Tax=Penaeus vannamei TaxID=6689 RepID=A0A3R7PAB8_PENVA|nr:Low affinity cationic amino acid transporter 2 [Penaeus vannamei]